MYKEMKRLYVEEKYTLRKIAKIFNTNHHFVKRRLQEMGVEITQKDRKRDPFSDEHRRKISENSKGRSCYWKGKKMPVETNYKNMLAHIQWKVDLSFLMQFSDIEKLKILNRMLSRDRVSVNFDTEKYKLFIEKFYNDENFNKQFKFYITSKNKWDMPSLDHVVPLSNGGTWDLENLQIISWFENRAKCDMNNEEFSKMIHKYFSKYFETKWNHKAPCQRFYLGYSSLIPNSRLATIHNLYYFS